MNTAAAITKLFPLLNERLRGEIPDLNKGGCGIFAYELAKLLKKKGIDFKIVILNNWRTDFPVQERNKIFKAVRNNMIPSNVDKIAFAHCAIEIDGVLYDGHIGGSNFISYWLHERDLFRATEYSLYDLYLAVKHGSWNPKFDMVKDKVKVKEELHKILN